MGDYITLKEINLFAMVTMILRYFMPFMLKIKTGLHIQLISNPAKK